MENERGEIIACEVCENQLEQVKSQVGMSEEEFELLKTPRKSLLVNFPIKLDNGDVRVISALRVQYNDALGPTKGGVRFHESVDFDEVSKLAFLMSLKTSLVGLPYGGAKGAVKINPKNFSRAELERISRAFVREMKEFIGPRKDIPAPDVNTNPQIMAWMMDEYERIFGEKSPGVITGKPVELGGSLGRNKSTAKGAFYVIEKIYQDVRDKSSIKVAIQGFGNAGSNLALMLHNAKFKVVAVSDSRAGVYNPDGLNIPELIEFKNKKMPFSDYAKEGEIITNEDLIKLEVDLLIPAALGDVISEKNADEVKAKRIVEVANGPITPKADLILESKGVEIIPDILANSGGVIVSYFEQVQNLATYYWSEEEVDNKLKDKIISAYERVLEEKASLNAKSFRTASYSLAIKRILEAERLRGNL
ncbi:Glu/Leu/Phe/Val dehydrogenase [Candidatus Pacearchaeota archaeon]|nr:MAG: Glu/Leu/Phe/Val dehydrogenase [Candidatus Pacearchaeota archaeon]